MAQRREARDMAPSFTASTRLGQLAKRRTAAVLHETATALLVKAIRAQTDVALKLRGRRLRPDDAEAQREPIKTQLAAALAMRERATELRDAWTRRWLMTKRKPRAKAEAACRRAAG